MRSRYSLVVALSLFAGGGTFTALERTADACGGCFHGPETSPENNTVVTDHRMIMAIDIQETTLYDQIRYEGSPDSFAWVLPIRGTARVGVSSDVVFAALDASTTVSVLAPPMNCPPPTNCSSGGGGGCGCSATATSAAADGVPERAAEDAGVSVLRQETVGPYETVQLRSTDPGALSAWLAKNGYTVPAAIAPIIDTYVSEQFDFLAVKLVPGKSVRAMVPIRVTTPGATPQLPLRMVAAGTGAMVGITLWIVADGRWEPKNFPSFVIKQEDVVWDWASSSSNFKTLRTENVKRLGAGAWEMEASVDLATSSLRTQIQFPSGPSLVNAPAYAPVLDDQGKVVMTSDEARADDLKTLLGDARRTTARITRLRADLPQASLATDLALQASNDQANIPTARNVTKEAGEPQCAIYDECSIVRMGTRSEANAAANKDALSGGGCSTKRVHFYNGLELAFALVGLGLLRRYAKRA